MFALVRHSLVVACCLPLVLAQSERRPESFQIAIGMQSRGLHEEAAGYLEKFLKQHANHALAPEAHYRLAQCRIELGNDEPAMASLTAALAGGGKQFSLRAEAQYRLGNLLQAKGDHKRALLQFQALVGEVADDHYLAAAARYAEGEAQRDLGRDKAAVATFVAAARLATGERAAFRFPALYQLGFAQSRLRDFDAAATAFTAAQNAAPDEAAKAECSYLIGDACLRLEQYDRAERAFQKSHQIGGEFADDAAYGLGWVALGRGDGQVALRAFKKLLVDHPRSPFAGNARLERGRCFYQAQQYEEAQSELQPLLRDGQPLQQDARELIGLCALASGAGQSAVEALQQALQAAADEDRPRLSFALGEALANLGRWSDALPAYTAVPTDVEPGLRGDALYGACHALHELGQHEQSIQRAEAVLQIEPPHRSRVLALLAIAENQFALRDYPAAERCYQALSEHRAHAAMAAWKLAWCRYLQGSKDDAAVRFAAVAADREDANAEEALAMQALALYETGSRDQSLEVADRYRARYRDGKFLDRTERIAARVLKQRGDLGAAGRRLARAASIAASRDGKDAASDDIAEQADLAYQQGDYQAADELFAQLIERSDAVGARAQAGRAWCAFEIGDDQVCEAALQTAKRHPEVEHELPGLLELESALYHRRQLWPQAILTAKAFLQQFEQHQKAPMLRYALGVACARNGDQQAAREVLTALAVEGSYSEQDRVLYELAWACRRDGDEEIAIATFARVAAVTKDVELAGESRLFVGTAALAVAEPNLKWAAEWLEAVEGSHQKQALYRLGFAEFEAAGDNDDNKLQLVSARDRFAQITQLPGDELVGEALFLGAECCRRLGDPDGAVQRAQRLLRDDPEHERADRARLVVGECALLAGKPNLSIAPLEQFLRSSDSSSAGGGDAAQADRARAHLWLGKARLARREYPAAENNFVKVTELSEGSLAAEAQFRLGESRSQRKDLNGAADAFVKLPILYADAVWVRAGLLHAGRTYQQLKQPKKAARFFRELVDKHAGSDEAKAAAEQLQNR